MLNIDGGHRLFERFITVERLATDKAFAGFVASLNNHGTLLLDHTRSRSKKFAPVR